MAEPQLEMRLRALFEQQATAEPSPSTVDAGRARAAGRVRLRRRRAGTSAAALLAVAIAALAVSIAARPAAGHRAPAGPDGLPSVAPRRFDPLTVYPTLSWLPAGIAPSYAETSQDEMIIAAGPRRSATLDWRLTVFAAGHCRLSRQPGPGRGRRRLACPRQSLGLSGPAPPVHGRQAFWGPGLLAWQYARNAWAYLIGPVSGPQPTGRPALARLAAGVRFGLNRGAGLFAARLTGAPAGWHVSSVLYIAGGSATQAGGSIPPGVRWFGTEYQVGGSGASEPSISEFSSSGYPFVSIGLASRWRACTPARTQRAPRMVDGHRVLPSDTPAAESPSGAKIHSACSVADGLQTVISEAAGHRGVPGVLDVFRHLRLLGTDPARWTTRPLG